MMAGGGGGGRLRISFMEAVYGFEPVYFANDEFAIVFLNN